MTLCNATNPPFLEGCVRPLDHTGKHSWVEGENIPPPWIPVPVIHLAVSGMPDGTMEIQHPSGECVFCDAERWRKGSHEPTCSTGYECVDPFCPMCKP